MNLPRRYPKEQYVLLKFLNEKSKISIEDVVNQIKIDQIFISGAVVALKEYGIVDYEDEVYQEVKLGKEGIVFKDKGLPEKAIVKTLEKNRDGLHIVELSKQLDIEQKYIGKNLKYLTDRGWAVKNGAELKITEKGIDAIVEDLSTEKAFFYIKNNGPIIIEEEIKNGNILKDDFEELTKRAQLLQVKERKKRIIWLTEQGCKLVNEGIEELFVATAITHELLKDGKWKQVEFKPYNIQDETAQIFPGKIHPFQKVLEETRKIYLEMGFTETYSPHIESSFWGFDALFQPQDHPARDMQDTFYMKSPAKAELPDNDLVEKVQSTHETGWQTGSKGWGYKWDSEIAKKMVLRTHTTAASIQSLNQHPQPPLKVFCIGKVFRRETIDYKHLPVFTQVDGIVVDKNASLANLIGLLREFYRKMGFDQIEVRPAFFPYTEPSLEIFVYLKEKKDWVEMGGAGIFRKEVTVPMGCNVPVLAWGLGLERLAMFRYRLSDIRNIYMADIKWLREVSLCQ